MGSNKNKAIHNNKATAPTGATTVSVSDRVITSPASIGSLMPTPPTVVEASASAEDVVAQQEPVVIELTKKQRNRIKRRAREEEEARKIAEMEAGLANSGTGTADGGVVNGGT
ncbi:hypothetical protein HDU76_002590, partial [Blyttiomyces sp. JEL0837]